MEITTVSMTNMIIPTLMLKNFDINWAMRSVPPVLVSYLSMIPIPTPIKIPPNIELTIG